MGRQCSSNSVRGVSKFIGYILLCFSSYVSHRYNVLLIFGFVFRSNMPYNDAGIKIQATCNLGQILQSQLVYMNVFITCNVVIQYPMQRIALN